MSKTSNYQVAGTFDVSTTGNIDDLDFQKCAVIRMTNASLATIRGLKAGYPGQTVTVVSLGAGQVNLAPANTGSAAANRLVNTVSNTPSSLAAGYGNATYVYDDTSARWRLVNHVQGKFITVPFNAGDFFTGIGGTTFVVASGDLVTFEYKLVQDDLRVSLRISGATITGVPGSVSVTIPGGFTVGSTVDDDYLSQSGGGAFLAAAWEGTAAATALLFYSTIAFGAWVPGADNVSIILNRSFRVAA